jgi:hypothetical protein
MPPKKENRGYLYTRLPADWTCAIKDLADQESVTPAKMHRILLSEALTARGVVHSVDDYGIFTKRWRATKRDIEDRIRKKRTEYVRRYRAKLKAKKQQAIADAANSITWTFHPSGQITTSDLDVLATFVGHVDERGRFTPENTRHSVQSARAKAREALNAGLLSGERWHLFVRDVPS